MGKCFAGDANPLTAKRVMAFILSEAITFLFYYSKKEHHYENRYH